MAPDSTGGSPSSTGVDPFRGVEPKSITEIALEENVDVEREDLPAAAKLTDLPLKWMFAAIVVCVGVTLIGQKVEVKQLRQVIADSGLLKPDDQKQADDGADQVERIVADRQALQKRLQELKERKRKMQELTQRDPDPSAPEPAQNKDLTDVPLTVEGLRGEIKARAGPEFESYRSIGTLVVLCVGGFGLILLALFVRLLWAGLFGGVAFAVAFFLGAETWLVWTVTALAAALGGWLGPKLLLAAVLTNTTLACMIIGGLSAGGGVYLGTGSELYALGGLGAGIVLGAVVGFKFARKLFLSSVLANSAGMAATSLWLLWGDLFPYFWPATMGGLMLLDGLATRLYHRIRWGV